MTQSNSGFETFGNHTTPTYPSGTPTLNLKMFAFQPGDVEEEPLEPQKPMPKPQFHS